MAWTSKCVQEKIEREKEGGGGATSSGSDGGLVAGSARVDTDMRIWSKRNEYLAGWGDGTWALQDPTIKGDELVALVASHKARREVGMRQADAAVLLHLLVHYPRILYVGFSFWRKLLINYLTDPECMCGGLSVDSSVTVDPKPDLLRRGGVPLPEFDADAYERDMDESRGWMQPPANHPTRLAAERGAMGLPTELRHHLPETYFSGVEPLRNGCHDEEWLGFLNYALKNNQVDVVSLLFKLLRFDPDTAWALDWDEAGSSPVRWGYTSMVEVLVSNGAAVNPVADGTKPPLHVAAEYGWPHLVKYFLDKGASTSVVEGSRLGETLVTPLHVAGQHGETTIELVNLLLDNGVQPDAEDQNFRQTPLDQLLKRASPATIRAFFAHRACRKIDVKSLVNHLDACERLPLSIVLANRKPGSDQVAVAKILIEQGADVNNGSWRPLHSCARAGNLEGAKLLLSHGAEVDPFRAGDMVDPDDTFMAFEFGSGWTPLATATVNGHTEMMKLLLASGASAEPGKTNPLAMGLLDLACRVDSVETRTEAIQVLLSHGANINFKTTGGNTPLHVHLTTLSTNADASIKLLIEFGADLNAVNDAGMTPLHRACARGWSETWEGSEAVWEETRAAIIMMLVTPENINKPVEGAGELRGKSPVDLLKITMAEATAFLARVGASPKAQHRNRRRIATSQQEEKQALGEKLYIKVQEIHPNQAPKITGMLLEMDIPEILNVLEDRDMLIVKVLEAVSVLQFHRSGNGNQAAVGGGSTRT